MHQPMMDNNSYNLIMALASNLEALEAYHSYAQDGEPQLWEEAVQHTEEIVKLLQEALPQLAQQGQQMGQTAQNYGSGPTNDLSAGPRNDQEAEGATVSQDENVIGTNPDGSKLYKGEDQVTYANEVINADEQRMGYRSNEGSQRY